MTVVRSLAAMRAIVSPGCTLYVEPILNGRNERRIISCGIPPKKSGEKYTHRKGEKYTFRNVNRTISSSSSKDNKRSSSKTCSSSKRRRRRSRAQDGAQTERVQHG